MWSKAKVGRVMDRPLNLCTIRYLPATQKPGVSKYTHLPQGGYEGRLVRVAAHGEFQGPRTGWGGVGGSHSAAGLEVSTSLLE